MATIPATITQLAKGAILVQWIGLINNADVGAPVSIEPYYDQKSIHVSGTYGTSGSVQLEGSNDYGSTLTAGAPTDWEVLHDMTQTAALAFTANATKKVLENTLWIRPHVTAGSTASNLNVEVLCVAKHE